MGLRPKTIEAVYLRRYSSFRDALTAITGNADTAHDAVQEAFAVALATRRNFRGGTPEAWIWRIAIRAALRTSRETPTLTDGEHEMDRRQATRDPQLTAALKRLAPRRRLIVFLRYFGDLSYSEIAAICGITEGTVAATLAQARSELAADLKEVV